MDKKTAVKTDWKIEDMPEKCKTFILERTFSQEQMDSLRKGNVPEVMEDKWFWYMEGDRLYAHRSWTGICIYIIDFKPDGKHLVTVNCDKGQYESPGAQEETGRLNALLDWWSQPAYDYYGEWISETLAAVEKGEEK